MLIIVKRIVVERKDSGIASALRPKTGRAPSRELRQPRRKSKEKKLPQSIPYSFECACSSTTTPNSSLRFKSLGGVMIVLGNKVEIQGLPLEAFLFPVLPQKCVLYKK